MRTNVADEKLLLRSLQDVVVLDDPPDRLEVDEALRRDGIVGVAEDVELELGGGHRREAALRGARHLSTQHAPRRQRHQLVAVFIVDIAQHERGLVVPRGDAQRVEVGNGPEVAVSLRPTGEPVAGHGIHVHVARQQIVAGVQPMRHHLIDEKASDETFADQASVHVGESGDDRLDLFVGHHSLQCVGIDSSNHDDTSRYTVFHSV